jgi:Predicted transcriptional regulators
MKERLVQLRKQAGLSQEELAEKLCTTRQAVSKWECGESLPSTENLIELSRFYKVSIDYIVGNEAFDGAVSSVKKKRIEEKDFWLDCIYPILVTIVYFILGYLFGVWHPGWLVFGTIPIYYAISGSIRERKNK